MVSPEAVIGGRSVLAFGFQAVVHGGGFLVRLKPYKTKFLHKSSHQILICKSKPNAIASVSPLETESKSDSEFDDLLLMHQNLVSAEREDIKAVLFLFLREKGFKSIEASNFVKQTARFVDHLLSELTNVYKSHYKTGRELTILEIRTTLIPYLEKLLEEHGDSLLQVLSKKFAGDSLSQARVAFTRVRQTNSSGNFSPLVSQLMDLGIKMEEIEGLVCDFPNFLKNERSIKSVVDLLLGLGMDPLEIPKIIRKMPRVITAASVENCKALVSYVMKLGLSNENIARAIVRHPSLLSCSALKVEVMVNYLREIGLTEQSIIETLTYSPQCYGLSVERNIKPTAKYFELIGVSILPFIRRAPKIFCLSIERKLKRVVEFFLERGCDMDEVRYMLTQYPVIFTLSLENLVHKWDYLLYMGYTKDDAVKTPNYFGASLEKRIKPRFEKMVGYGLRLPISTFVYSKDSKFEVFLEARRAKDELVS